jgi:hypothetical protein
MFFHHGDLTNFQNGRQTKQIPAPKIFFAFRSDSFCDRVGKLIFADLTPPVGYLPPHDSPSNINGFVTFQAIKTLSSPAQNFG